MQFNFDATTIEPVSFTSIPLGDYKVVVRSSEPKTTKDGQGGYIEFMLEIIEGPLRGTTQPYNLNLHNQNQKTVEIAYRQLSALCHVLGVYRVQDTQQLHNIPFIAQIGPQKDNPQYNDVKAVKDINGNAPGKQGQPAAPAALPTVQSAFGSPATQPAAPAFAPPAAQPAVTWGTQPAQPAAPAAPAWGAPAQPAVQPPPVAPPANAWQPNPGATPVAPAWSAPPAGGPPAWPGK